jgi:hypothetical protein
LRPVLPGKARSYTPTTSASAYDIHRIHSTFACAAVRARVYVDRDIDEWILSSINEGYAKSAHLFSVRTLLDETGAPLKVQQELMRHADIRTTLNVYGKAMDASKREAHSKVVRLVLPAKVA